MGLFDEWVYLSKAFRWSVDARERAIGDSSLKTMFEQMLVSLLTEKSEPFRVHLCVFAQENARVLLGNEPDARLQRLHSLCKALDRILTNDATASWHLKGQVLVTTTTVLIEVDAPQTSPGLFQSFLECLQNYISKVNDGKGKEAGRELRQMACESLRMLEMTYPGLLAPMLKDLRLYCDEECTHVLQSYLQLFALVFRNAMQLLVDKEPVDMGGFLGEVPSRQSTSEPGSGDTGGSGGGGAAGGGGGAGGGGDDDGTDADSTLGGELSEQEERVRRLRRRHLSPLPRRSMHMLHDEGLRRAVRKVVSVLQDNRQQLTEWGLVDVALNMLSFVQLQDQGVTMFKHTFATRWFTDRATLMHVVLRIYDEYPEAFTARDQQHMIERLLVLMNDGMHFLPHRILAVQWLLSLTTMKDATSPLFLQQLYHELYPRVFDPLDLMDARLHALCRCFSVWREGDAPPRIPTAPATLFEVMECLKLFRYYPASSRMPIIVYSVLFHFLASFPTLYLACQQFLTHHAMEQPKFLDNTVVLLNRLAAHDPSSRVPARVLSAFNTCLVSLEQHKIRKYFSLVARIVKESDIDPANIIRAVLRYVRNPRVCKQASWTTGQQVLDIARTCLQHHPTARIFAPLSDLLLFLATYFADVDVRDRANTLYQLLTHVSGDKLVKLLRLPASHGEVQQEFVIPPHRQPHILHAGRFHFLTLMRIFSAEGAAQGDTDPQPQTQPQVKGSRSAPTTPVRSRRLSRVAVSAVPASAPPRPPAPPPLPPPPEAFPLFVEYLTAIHTGEGQSRIHLTFRLAYSDAMATVAPVTPLSAPSTPVFGSSSPPAASAAGGEPASPLVSREDTGDMTPTHTNTRLPDDELPLPPALALDERLKIDEHLSPRTTSAMCPPKLFGIKVSFSESPHYAPIPPVRLPYLCQAAHARDAARFPHGYDVVLAVRPLAPVPSRFGVNLMFNDEQGRTCSGTMNEISVYFRDLFLPVAIPASLQEQYACHPPSELLHTLFAAMWARVSRRNHGLPDPLPAGVCASDGSAAVKTLEIRSAAMLEALSTSFAPFMVSRVHDPSTPAPTVTLGLRREEGEEEDEEAVQEAVEEAVEGGEEEEDPALAEEEVEGSLPVLLAMVFLPPRHHILLKMYVCEDSTTVRIRTDHWRVLAYIDSFFDEFRAKAELDHMLRHRASATPLSEGSGEGSGSGSVSGDGATPPPMLLTPGQLPARWTQHRKWRLFAPADRPGDDTPTSTPTPDALK